MELARRLTMLLRQLNPKTVAAIGGDSTTLPPTTETTAIRLVHGLLLFRIFAQYLIENVNDAEEFRKHFQRQTIRTTASSTSTTTPTITSTTTTTLTSQQSTTSNDAYGSFLKSMIDYVIDIESRYIVFPRRPSLPPKESSFLLHLSFSSQSNQSIVTILGEVMNVMIVIQSTVLFPIGQKLKTSPMQFDLFWYYFNQPSYIATKSSTSDGTIQSLTSTTSNIDTQSTTSSTRAAEFLRSLLLHFIRQSKLEASLAKSSTKHNTTTTSSSALTTNNNGTNPRLLIRTALWSVSSIYSLLSTTAWLMSKLTSVAGICVCLFSLLYTKNLIFFCISCISRQCCQLSFKSIIGKIFIDWFRW
jgi:hypothetical protein